MDAANTQLIYAAAAVLCAGVACVFDLRDRRIPNRLTGPALLAGLGAHWAISGRQDMAEAAVAAVLGGLVFLVFYLAGGMGAGDVKLVAATASLVGMSSLPALLISTAIAGALFAIAISACRGVLRQTIANTWAVLAHHKTNGLLEHPELNLANPSAMRLPYALPIAAGCFATLLKAVAHR